MCAFVLFRDAATRWLLRDYGPESHRILTFLTFVHVSCARTCHVVFPTCRAGKNYMACRRNYMPSAFSCHRDSFGRKQACGYEKRAVFALFRAFALQRYNIFRPKARSVKIRGGQMLNFCRVQGFIRMASVSWLYIFLDFTYFTNFVPMQGRGMTRFRARRQPMRDSLNL